MKDLMSWENASEKTNHQPKNETQTWTVPCFVTVTVRSGGCINQSAGSVDWRWFWCVSGLGAERRHRSTREQTLTQHRSVSVCSLWFLSSPSSPPPSARFPQLVLLFVRYLWMVTGVNDASSSFCLHDADVLGLINIIVKTRLQGTNVQTSLLSCYVS